MAIRDPDKQRNPPHDEEDSNYLYHKQPRGVPRRHSGYHSNVDDTNRRFTERNVARETFWRNIRTFSFMILGMLLFLGLAFYIARKNWADKQTKIRQQGQQARQPVPPAFSPRGTPEPMRAATRREPSETEKSKAAFTMERANAFELAGNYDEAIIRFQQAIALWDAVPGGWIQLARTYAKQKKLGQARDAYTHAIQYDPGNTEILNELAMIFLQHGQTEKAITHLTNAIESDPTNTESYLNLSLCYLSMRNTSDAEKILNACLERFPDNTQALKELAYIKASSGDYEATLSILNRAIEINPSWAPLYFDAAATCALMRQEDAAFAYLHSALTYSNPDDIHNILKQPAFESFLQTEKGKSFINEITERLTTQQTTIEEAKEN